VQGATGVALLLAAVALGIWGRLPVLAASVSVTAWVIGVAALGYPDRIGATEGTRWAFAAALWGVLVALAAAVPALRAPRDRSRPAAAEPAGTLRAGSPDAPLGHRG
jgi:hypothetical protein